MARFVRWIRRVIHELRRRRVLRVAGVYAGTAFVILQLGEILVGPFGLPGWTLRMVTFLLVLGFPLAVGLAWVYNITEEGLVRDAGEEDAGEIGPEGTPLTSNGVLVGLLVLIAGLLLYPRVFSSERPTSAGEPATPDTAQIEERSIAVLPFENQGGKKSKQFTEGVHDGLLTKLSRVSDLKVISRTSVAQYAETDKTIPQIAEELGARWIVEGAVQRVGGQVQVNAQLIRAPSDAHRWAKSYRRPITPESFFAIQSELTKKIARSLRARLTPEEKRQVERQPTQDLRAYQLYVQGRQELAQRQFRQGEHVRMAAKLFRRAIEQDSTFALAWAGLADTRPNELPDSLGLPDVSQIEAARRALELGPDLAEAHASMGFVYLRQHKGPEALRALQRAVRLKPSYAEAQGWLGRTYLMLGRPKKGLRHLKLAEELDPRHLAARHVLYDTYVMVGKYEKALNEIREQRRRYPDWSGSYTAQSRALYHLGRFEKAAEVYRRGHPKERKNGSEEGRSWWHAYLAAMETALGDTARARKRLETLQEGDTPPIVLAYAHAALGNTDAVLTAFERVEDWGYVPTFTLRYMTFPEGMGKIRDRPRYEALIREVNRYWGLRPDGTIPEPSNSTTTTAPEADA